MTDNNSSSDSEVTTRSFVHTLAPIRLGEFDIGSVLYHGRYFNLLEETREAFLREIETPYPELVDKGMHLTLTESRQRFLAPIRYGEEITARLTFTDVRRTSFVARYELYGPAELVVHQAETRHACIKLQPNGAFKVVALPEKLLEGLNGYTV